jgi:hypothetical protein
MKCSGQCSNCGKHQAVFFRNGIIRRERKHDVCMRCYRSLRNAFFAKNLMEKMELI